MFNKSLTLTIETILSRYPETRDNDMLLMIRVWEQAGHRFPTELREAFISGVMASPETIRRTRQKVQETGRYRATEATQQARAEKQQRVVEEVKPVINKESIFDMAKRLKGIR